MDATGVEGAVEVARVMGGAVALGCGEDEMVGLDSVGFGGGVVGCLEGPGFGGGVEGGGGEGGGEADVLGAGGVR